MKTRRFLVLLVALLLLGCCSCRKEEELPPPAADGSETPPADTGDEGSEPDTFFETHGYPADYAIRFSAGENGFDTAMGELRCEGVSYTYDFTPKLASLYYDASEDNFTGLPEDLTFRTLTGNDPPAGTQTFCVGITAGGVTHTVVTDAEALKTENNSDIANLRALINEFLHLIPVYAADAAPKPNT